MSYKFKRSFLVTSMIILVALSIGVVVEYKVAKESVDAESLHQAMQSKQLDFKLQQVKNDLQAQDVDTIKVRLKTITIQPSAVFALYENSNHKDAGEEKKLLSFIDSTSYSALKHSKLVSGGNSELNVDKLSFGAAEEDLRDRSNIIQREGKVSLSLAKSNGLAVMGKVIPTGEHRPQRATLDFVLTYLDKQAGMKSTPFSEDLAVQQSEGTFFHRIWLEDDQYQPGLYLVTVYYNGRVISRQNLELYK